MALRTPYSCPRMQRLPRSRCGVILMYPRPTGQATGFQWEERNTRRKSLSSCKRPRTQAILHVPLPQHGRTAMCHRCHRLLHRRDEWCQHHQFLRQASKSGVFHSIRRACRHTFDWTVHDACHHDRREDNDKEGGVLNIPKTNVDIMTVPFRPCEKGLFLFLF